MLIEQRGDVYAATGRPEDALAPAGGRVNGTLAVADGGVERETPVAFHVAVLPQQPGIARTRAGACSYTGFACP